MKRTLVVTALARVAVSAAALTIIVFLFAPSPANAQGGTASIPQRRVSLPYLTAGQRVSAPAFTSSPDVVGRVGMTYTYAISLTGVPHPTVRLQESPEGMTIDEGGLIEWTPHASGTFPVTVVASNGVGPDAAQTFTINVDGPQGDAPIITSTPALTATVGTTYTYALATDGDPAPKVMLEESPAGMTIDESGLIEWIPAATGTFSVTVVASNDAGPDAAQSFAIEVAELEVVIPDRIWDPRLDQRGAELIEAEVQPGQGYWRLVEAHWLNKEESANKHHILMDVLDEDGNRLVGVPIWVSWYSDGAMVYTQEKFAEPYAADFGMYHMPPTYGAGPDTGAPADRVHGMGLGELYDPYFAHHTSYVLIWRWTVMPR